MRFDRGSVGGSDPGMNRSETLVIVLVSAALGACSGPASDPGPVPEFEGLAEVERSVQAGRSSSRPLAFVNGRPVAWSDLRLDLLEAQGAATLQDLVLGESLEREAKRRGVLVTDDDVEHERSLLLESMETAGDSPDQAEDLLARVRSARGLGPARFGALLRRNALLRALVRNDIEVSDVDVQRAFEILHGPRYQVRVIMCATELDASRIRRAILLAETPETRRTAFIEQAVAESLDLSSRRGGLIEQISASDPTYPDAFSQMLSRMPPGELSPIIALDNGAMLLWVEERLAPDGVAFETVEAQLRADVRTGRERLEMDRLARRLVVDADVSVVDASLSWAWERRSRPQP